MTEFKLHLNLAYQNQNLTLLMTAHNLYYHSTISPPISGCRKISDDKTNFSFYYQYLFYQILELSLWNNIWKFMKFDSHQKLI